jgi:hypothetical protein
MDNPADEDEGTPEPGSSAVTIELVEDELVVDKHRVQTGLARIRRQLISEVRTFEVTIPMRSSGRTPAADSRDARSA